MGKFGSGKDDMIMKKIYQDKGICKHFKKMYDGMLVLSIIVLFFAIPEIMEAFRNNVDWFDKLIPILFALYGIVNLVESVINTAKLNMKKSRN